MGHNASQSTRRANALGARLGDVYGWRVIAECTICARSAQLDVGALAVRYGRETTVRGVVHRLRRATCRAASTAVGVGDRYHLVPVRGPGSMA